jgi:hypothetical protein
MQIGHTPPAAGAAHALSELNGREIFAVDWNEIGGVEHAPVLAAAADGNQGHLGGDELREGSANAVLAGVAVARPHLVRRLHACLWPPEGEEGPPAGSRP